MILVQPGYSEDESMQNYFAYKFFEILKLLHGAYACIGAESKSDGKVLTLVREHQLEASLISESFVSSSWETKSASLDGVEFGISPKKNGTFDNVHYDYMFAYMKNRPNIFAMAIKRFGMSYGLTKDFSVEASLKDSISESRAIFTETIGIPVSKLKSEEVVSVDTIKPHIGGTKKIVQKIKAKHAAESAKAASRSKDVIYF